jgi:hypothetical protein
MNNTVRKEAPLNAKPNAAFPTPMAGLAKPLEAVLGKPLEQRRLRLLRASESADFGNLWAAVLPAGVPFEAALAPRFWVNHATRLHVGDQIEIHIDDQSFFGRLLVRHLGGATPGKTHTEADVVRLEYYEFDQVVPVDDAAATHRVEHRGPHLQHCVVRVSDGKIVSDGNGSKEAAEAALKALMRVA